MVYHLYFFSATGNTAHCADMIKEGLTRAGHSVKTLPINRWARPFADTPDCLVIAFPTLAWRPPSLVMRFLSRLPKGDGRFAAILTADGGASFGSVDVAERRLRRRGYRTFIKAAASYPDNWVETMSTPTGDTRKDMIAAGIRATEEFIAALLEERPIPRKRPLGSGPLNIAGLAFALIGRRFLGKLFIADDDCASCGRCARTCPVGAIAMGAGPKARPYWKFNCESCNRCINSCAARAINASLGRGIILIITIAALCVSGNSGYRILVAPMLAALPFPLAPVLNVAGHATIVATAHVLALTLFDSWILRPLQSIRPIGILMRRSLGKGFARYVYDGYEPPVESR